MKQKFKNLLAHNRWIKAIPNSLTLCNSLCGFASILITLQAYKYAEDPKKTSVVFAWSAGMILFAMIFDALDGFVARILNAASMHGLQMDSLSDMVTFGVAPATLVAVMAHNMRHLETPREFIPICILCAVYLGCAALRLATYNVHAILERKSSEKFSGLPSPGAAAAICSLVIFTAFREGKMEHVIRYLPLYAALLGILMVSPIPYVHIAKWFVSIKRNRKRLFFLMFLLAAWVLTALKYNWYVFPVAVINIYVFWGPVSFFAAELGFIRKRPESEEPAAEKDKPR